MIESSALTPARSNAAPQTAGPRLSRRGFIGVALAGTVTAVLLGPAPLAAMGNPPAVSPSGSAPIWEYAYVYAY